MAKKTEAPAPASKHPTRVIFIEKGGRKVEAVSVKVLNETEGRLKLNAFPPGGVCYEVEALRGDKEGDWTERAK